MTDSAAILELRHCRVAEQATLQPVTPSEGEAGVFIAVDDPPPVRTVLAVIEGSQRRALEVASVVEVAERCGVAISGIEVTEPDLEAVFLHLTGTALRE